MRARLAIAAVLATVAAAGAAAEGAPAGSPGKISVVRNTGHDFDRFVTGSTPAQRSFMREHYWRMRGYAPFFDQALRWAPPAHVYLDLYALYPSLDRDRRLLAKHPNWVLRDASGRRLYIPHGCSGGSCSAFAANPGSAGFRRSWIRRAKRHVADGYRGLFIDNVNLEMRVSDGHGNPVAPRDPRTGDTMTLPAWRSYVAGFTERIRTELPRAEIVHNGIWFAPRSDSAVERQIEAADVVELERGCSDPGIVGGWGTFGIYTLLAHIDWIHSLGASVLLEPYGRDPSKREYDVACYFLTSSGQDAIASAYQTDPNNWWHGWNTDLGAPTGSRYDWNGMIRRDFTKGFVVLNPPGQPSRQASFSGLYRNLAGQLLIGSVTVPGGQARVLIKAL